MLADNNNNYEVWSVCDLYETLTADWKLLLDLHISSLVYFTCKYIIEKLADNYFCLTFTVQFPGERAKCYS